MTRYRFYVAEKRQDASSRTVAALVELVWTFCGAVDADDEERRFRDICHHALGHLLTTLADGCARNCYQLDIASHHTTDRGDSTTRYRALEFTKYEPDVVVLWLSCVLGTMDSGDRDVKCG